MLHNITVNSLNTAKSQSFSNENKQNHEKQDSEKDLENMEIKAIPLEPKQYSNKFLRENKIQQQVYKPYHRPKTTTLFGKKLFRKRVSILNETPIRYQIKTLSEKNQKRKSTFERRNSSIHTSTFFRTNTLEKQIRQEKNMIVSTSRALEMFAKVLKKPQDKRPKIKVSKINKTHQVQIKKVTLEKKKSGQNVMKSQTNNSVKSFIFKTIPKKKKKQVDLEFQLSGW